MPKKLVASARRAEPAVKLSARGVARLQARHPWVYRSDIIEEKDVPPGAVVRVLDQRGKFLGTALYSSSSQIAIRMISHGSVADPPALVAERIRAAVAYRENLVTNTDAYRIVFSEADFLPGLIVDRYNDVISLQILTQAMDSAAVREAILRTLAEMPWPVAAGLCPAGQVGAPAPTCGLQPVGIVERVDARIRELEQLPPRQSGLLWGEKSSTAYSMNRVRFHYDGEGGRRLGRFWISGRTMQRQRNMPGVRRWTFSVTREGLRCTWRRVCRVTGVDSSRPALEMAEKNAALECTTNGREIEWIEGNAFDVLREYSAGNRAMTPLFLIRPAFAKTKRDLDKALRGYKELNLRAMKMLRSGGILVTCSCSFHVSAAEFLKVCRSCPGRSPRICGLWRAEERPKIIQYC